MTDELAAAIDDQRRRTRDRIAGLERDFAVIVEAADLSPPDDEHDPEGATVGFERAQISALLTSARAQLAALDAAQERLAAGTYGRCERCAEQIAVDRLLARPTATTCVACSADLFSGRSSLPERRARPS